MTGADVPVFVTVKRGVAKGAGVGAGAGEGVGDVCGMGASKTLITSRWKATLPVGFASRLAM